MKKLGIIIASSIGSLVLAFIVAVFLGTALSYFSSGQTVDGVIILSLLLVIILGLCWLVLAIVHRNKKKCSHCKKWMKKEIQYCTQCGHDFNPPLLTCPSCNELLSKDIKFCPSCGMDLKPTLSTPDPGLSTTILASSLTPTIPATPLKNECPNCHEKTRSGESFCGHCGHSLTSTPIQTQLGS